MHQFVGYVISTVITVLLVSAALVLIGTLVAIPYSLLTGQLIWAVYYVGLLVISATILYLGITKL